MIPTEDEIKKLWEKYQLPRQKRVHVELVARVAMALANYFPVDKKLLFAAALLHDIDKAAPKLPGERHPDAAVRILREEGMNEVADVVRTHPLHAILNPTICPTTWEQKLLYLADKMVKYEIIGVDRRFALWRDEHLSKDVQHVIDECYPKVKKLEQEVFNIAGISFDDIKNSRTFSSAKSA